MDTQVTDRRQLTDRWLRSIKPDKDRALHDVMDTIVPGFGVRVSSSGRRTFMLIARYGGAKNPTRRSVGVFGALNLDQARTKARLWLETIQRGEDPAQIEERLRIENIRKQQTTFAAVAEDFIRDKLPEERKGKDVEREIRKDLLPAWKNKPVAEITDLDVISVLKSKKRLGPRDGKVGARNLLALIKRFFRWAIAQRAYGIEVSPAATLRAADIVGRPRGSRKRILTDDEMFALWRAANRMKYPVGSAYKMLMLTGLRLNEAAGAAWTEFDFREGLWVIPAERMKGRNTEEKQARPHAVPLIPAVRKIVEAAPRPKKAVFTFSTTLGKRPVSIGTKVKSIVNRRMHLTLRALAKERGEDPRSVFLPHFVNHDIRRTVRSQLSRLKVTEEAREAVLAHARPGIKGVYDIHDYLDEKREALDLWAERLNSIVQRKTTSQADQTRFSLRTEQATT